MFTRKWRQALTTATLMRMFALLVVIALGGVLGALPATAQTSAPSKTSFTYQGQLLNAGSRLNATCSFQFTLYDAATAGNIIGETQTVANVAVQDSYFAAQLDFGVTPFGDAVRYLALAIQCPPETDFTAMEGRMALTAAPAALVAQKAFAAPWSGITEIPANLASFSSLACTNGQVAKWNSPKTAWECAADNDLDTDTLASLTCTNGQIAKWNGSAWACTVDNDTTYTAGTGLALTGTTFSLASVENVPIGATTPSTGKFTTLEATTSLKTPALETGSLKVTGGSPAVGSVLTSDLNGNATWKPKLSKIIYVADSGGDFTTITAALNSLTDASATKPYLVRVAPGIYTEQVTMKSYVSIEGAGEGVTIIKYTGSATIPSATNSSSATVIGANNAELSNLTVQSVSTLAYATAIYNNNTSPTLSHLTITASGGTSYNYGVYNNASSPVMSNLTITASGGSGNFGVYNNASSPVMSNLTITASGGTYNYGVHNITSSSPVMSNLTITASGGTYNYSVYNNASSPVMSNLTITASGGTYNEGVFNITSSSPVMSNLTITASGGTYNNGMDNNASSPVMSNLTITASGGTNHNIGVYNNASSPVMSNLTITPSGGTSNFGVFNYSSSSSTIYSSRIKGTINSVFNDGVSTAKIASTMLDGPVTATGSTCIGSYNASFVALSATCQ